MGAAPLGPTSRLILEYDGSRFHGWAKQPGLRTVQGVLEETLCTILRQAPAELRLKVGGRTDRGVHAWGQVASYQGPPLPPVRLNGLLPQDVAVRACTAAPPAFDARADARSRIYCYRVLASRERAVFCARTALWWPYPLAGEQLQRCAELLTGEHDFRAFTPTKTEHVRFRRRVFAARWEARGPLLEFWIEADAYLRQMNRILVGTMLEVGSGRRTVDGFAALLEGRPRTEAGPTAPAHGLALARVTYDGEDRLGEAWADRPSWI